MTAGNFTDEKDGDITAKHLTLRQRRFIAEYITNGDPYQAAKLAGYRRPGIGNTLVSKLHAQILQQKAQEWGREPVAGETELLALLSAVLRGELQEGAVVKLKEKRTGRDENGQPVSEETERAELALSPPRIADRFRAAELLGKWYGLFGGDKGAAPVTAVVQYDYDGQGESDGEADGQDV